MNATFDALPADTRRALARAELRKRGLRLEADDPGLQAAFADLRAGIAGLPGRPRFADEVCAMADRIEAGAVTPEDTAMLASVPNCSQTAVELVQLFAEIERAY